MTKEEFTPLKEFCDNNGYELLNADHEDNEKYFVIAKKKDPWDGVEFARHKFPNAGQFACFKIKSISEQLLTTEGGVELFKGNCEPITESAYKAQLEKVAFEKFGEIKEGDRFDRSNVDKNWESVWHVSGLDFNYDKEIDRLYIGNLAIYQSGKWAAKISKKIKVTPGFYKSKGDNFMKRMKCSFDVQDLKNSADTSGIMDFLSLQLEKYLNGEIE